MLEQNDRNDVNEAPTPPRHVPLWTWGVIAVVAVGAVIVLSTMERRTKPPEAYRYDVAKHEHVEPALVTFEETERIAVNVENPRGLAAAGGNVYVSGENVIAVHDRAGKETARFRVNGTPECLAVAPDGEILAGMEKHVEVLSAEGKSNATWENLGFQACITSIVANQNDVYVADAGNRVVVRYGRDGQAAQRIGEEDPARDIPGFVVPSPHFDVAFDDDGALWAVNPGLHGLEQYRPNGDLVTSWYRPSMSMDGFCGCCNPTHIAFRSDGSLVTVEKGIVRVKLYAPDWTLAGVAAAPEVFLDKPTDAFASELESPIRDMAVDAQNRILVLDGKKNAVRVFEAKGKQP